MLETTQVEEMKRVTTERTIEVLLRAFVKEPGFLEDSGWFESMARGEPLDRQGRPLPWLTYPALAFLGERVRPEMTVFEYGSGNSTLWWGERVARLVSCEHDKEWYSRFRSRISADHIRYLWRRHKGGCPDYAAEILHYHKEFHLLVIDGRQRVACARNGLAALRDDGVVIWDNSDREAYRPGYDLLAAAGFRRLDFWGPGPLATRCWCTSIFYRSGNCLAL